MEVEGAVWHCDNQPGSLVLEVNPQRPMVPIARNQAKASS